VIFVLICVLGVVPVVLAGEVLGWWQVMRSAPYIHPLDLPWSHVAMPPGMWMVV
jgi:hypothetical protein